MTDQEAPDVPTWTFNGYYVRDSNGGLIVEVRGRYETRHTVGPLLAASPLLLPLAKALRAVLGFFESDAYKSEATMAWIHGHRCDEAVSSANAAMIEEARRLLAHPVLKEIGEQT